MITVMPYERALHYRNGAFVEVLQPGRHRLWGFGHRFERIDMRSSVLTLAAQSAPTSDGITVKASAALTWRIEDPQRWHEASLDPRGALYDAAKAAVRTILVGRTVDELAAGIVDATVPETLGETASSVGVVVEAFAVRDVVAPAGIRRARESLVETRTRAQVDLEAARAQTAVLRHLANVAGVLEDHPALASLKLVETAGEHGGTVVIERPRA